MPNLTTTICENVKIIGFFLVTRRSPSYSSSWVTERGGGDPHTWLARMLSSELHLVIKALSSSLTTADVRTASSELKFQSWLVSPFLAVSYEYAHFCAFFSSSHSYFFLCEVLRWWKVSKSYQLTIKWKGALTRRDLVKKFSLLLPTDITPPRWYSREPPDFNISQTLVNVFCEILRGAAFLGYWTHPLILPFHISFFFFPQPTSPKFGKADSYEKLEKLGEGSYATVYKGKSK